MVFRLRIVFLLLSILFIIVLVRLFYWSVSSFDVLRGLSDSQTINLFTVKAQRGKIFSSDGSPLVINKRADSIYLEPNKIQNKKITIASLSQALGIDEASISAKLTDPSKVWVPLVEKVDDDKVTRIKSYNLPGIAYVNDSRRYYPEASMAAQTFGFIGKNAKGESQGYFGLEGYYDEQLRGRDGKRRIETDAHGNPILAGNRVEFPSEDGRDLYLTLDKSVQYIAESKLSDAVVKYGAKGGTVTVMDPMTGAILAMASTPSYDPASYGDYPVENYKNPTVASSYEPGSTFKPLIIAGAINDGKLTADGKFNEDGPVEIGGYSINTWNRKYHGEITITQILEYSSNVGMVYVSRQLGSDALLGYIKALGFGTSVGIDLEEESSSDLRPLNRWYEIDYATASFGQGIAVTPLQMVRAIAAIANGGQLMHPYLVKRIVGNGKNIDIKPQVERRVFSKETATTVTEMMVLAVDKGEASFAKPKGYRIAGKTGTAQIPIQGHYDNNKTIASFVGFAPADRPKFIMLVTLTEPSTSQWGSETAAPLFFSIAKDLFSYYGISPSP